jgi:hypothetical protein
MYVQIPNKVLTLMLTCFLVLASSSFVTGRFRVEAFTFPPASPFDDVFPVLRSEHEYWHSLKN